MLLLLTYSLGFAHNFIPHHHDVDTEVHEITHEKNGHHHHHHNTSKHLNSVNEHISHEDHYDEDLLDLLLCFLHKAEHHENDCKDQHFLPAKSNTLITNKLYANELIAVLFSLNTETEKNGSISSFTIDPEVSCLSLLIEDNSLRGPPQYS